jgi:Zn-dependent peptidase ImmA (M78 family)
MNSRAIANATISILKEFSLKTIPIPIEQVAKHRGVKVMPYDLGQNISGVLIIENGKGIIGYNQKESKVRRRFTIAHELGHFELHKNQNHLFVDKDYKILFRHIPTLQSETSQLHEIEANSFAAALLMPETFLLEEISKIDFDLGSEKAIKELAKKFDVSSTAMSYRLANLNIH